MLNAKVHDSTRLNKYVLFGKVASRKPLLFKKDMRAWLRFANYMGTNHKNLITMSFGQTKQT